MRAIPFLALLAIVCVAMSEPTPSYYPEGWDRERVLNLGVSGESMQDMPQEVWDTFRKGLRADLGQQKFEEFFEEMYRRELEAKGAELPPKVIDRPPFLQTTRGQVVSTAESEPWGFAVFKSPEIRDLAEWEACRQRFDKIINDGLKIYRGYPGLDEALSNMTFQWVEDVGDIDGSIESIATACDGLKRPRGLDHGMCLYITPTSLRSILDSPLPSSTNRRFRKDIPFVVAVIGQSFHAGLEQEPDDTAGKGWRGWVNVGVEALLDSFYMSLAILDRSLFDIGQTVDGEDIYCDHSRFGVHKPGVGYYDRRTGRTIDEL